MNHLLKCSITIVTLLFLCGCTITNIVQPIRPSLDPQTPICIEKNDKVIITDFIYVLTEGIERNGFKAEVFTDVPDSCTYTLKYTAYQKWDLTKFMSKANIEVYERKKLVGYIKYELPQGIFGGGGINPKKWGSTKDKLDPLIDELFDKLR